METRHVPCPRAPIWCDAPPTDLWPVNALHRIVTLFEGAHGKDKPCVNEIDYCPSGSVHKNCNPANSIKPIDCP